MRKTTFLSSTAASLLVIASTAFQAHSAVSLSNVGTTAPAAGDGFQNLNSSGAAGGGDYSDGGGLGQSFTLAPGFNYSVNAYSLMYNGDTAGGTPFTSTWNAQIVRYDNVHSGGFGSRTPDDPIVGSGPYSTEYLTNPITAVQFFDFAGPGAVPTVGDWVTLSFTGGDVLTLPGGFTYGIVLSSDSGWSRWAVGNTDAIPGGERFRAYGGPNFNDQYVNQSNANDRTFVLNLTATAVPEPSAALFGGLGLLGLLGRRRRC